MAKTIFKKWEVITPNTFGDFNISKEEPYYGILKIVGGYTMGIFNKDKQKNGICMTRLADKVNFGKYSNDKIIYPLVTVLEVGNVSLLLKEEGDIQTRLYIDTANASFEYYQCNKEGQKLGVSIYFISREHKFYYIKWENGKIVKQARLETEFVTHQDLDQVNRVKIPLNVDFSQFRYSGDDEYSYMESSSSTRSGVGIIAWDNNTSVVGGWDDNFRSGWQIYQFEKYWTVYHGEHAQYDGIQINIYDSGDVYINNYVSVDDQDKCSAMIHISKSSLYYIDTTENDYNDNDPMVRIRGFKDISFKGKDGKYSNYYADDMLGDGPSLKVEEAKEGDDKNDPEYLLNNLIGQEEAKKEVKRIKAYVTKNNSRSIYKNIIFTGETGVGKSTVGKLIAKLLYKYNAISNSDYIEKNAKELFNQYTGETRNNINALVKAGSGGVILIDDLHYIDALNGSNIREGIAALANAMENNPDTVFILCDNKYNINMITDNYKDLLMDKIRFHVNFKDFSREELKQILAVKVKEKGYEIKEDAMEKLLDVIFLSKSYGNNINASAAVSILEEVIVNQNVRTELVDDKTITVDDVSVYITENGIAFIDKSGGKSEARKRLDEMIGLEHIKETIDDLIAYFSINRGKKVDFHMAFTGNPGTGKTEVARIIGKLLREEGILPTSKFVEVTRRDLVGQYIGQTAIITRDTIDKAMGGVLYIDEAYSLAHGGEKDFGPEAIAELLKAMEDRRGEFCVIMSGYTNEMRKLFDLNPGFKSRIKFDLEFPDYNDEELEKIAQLFLRKDNFVMSEENLKLFVKIVGISRNYANFANVRTLREGLSKIQIKHVRRVKDSGGDVEKDNVLTLEDIKLAYSEKEVNIALELAGDKKSPVIKPEVLKEQSSLVESVPFEKRQEIVSETILALKMSEGKSGEGTGFIVSKEGYFVTCNHCVEGAAKLTARRRIRHHNRYIDINYDAEVICTDKEADVALCKLKCEDGEEFDYLAIANDGEHLDKLSDIYLLGYPFGVSRFDELSINKGKVASYQKGVGSNPDQINLDIQAKGGNSGSPLLDAKTSRVIGILCGASLSYHGDLTEEINYGRPIDYLWRMIEKESK